jgi:hypothetical protein
VTQFVLEWNKGGNIFNVQPLEKSLAWSQQCFMEDRLNFWTVLMVGTYDVVTTMADFHQHRLESRSGSLSSAARLAGNDGPKKSGLEGIRMVTGEGAGPAGSVQGHQGCANQCDDCKCQQ